MMKKYNFLVRRYASVYLAYISDYLSQQGSHDEKEKERQLFLDEASSWGGDLFEAAVTAGA